MADDLGFNELGYMNSTRGLITPNIDSLASEAVKLYSYYTNPLCSPSRSALMTGIFNHRIGTQANVIYWDTPWAPSPSLKFLPQRFKDLGYSTGMFGKWHLGMHKTSAYPTSRGFDEFAGYLQGCESHGTRIASCCDAPVDPQNSSAYVCPAPTSGEDYRGYDWFSGETPDRNGTGAASSDLIASRAEAFIASHATAPFFLYLPFQNIHAPYDCSAESLARFAALNASAEQRTVFGYILELDAAIGRVVAALAAAGVSEETAIVFASDNGAPSDAGVTGRNYPLRGFKSQVWEGGVRVPAFVHAPGLGLAPASVDALVHVSDWTPTLVALAGGAVEPGLDGLDVWSVLRGGPGVRSQVPANINPLCDGGQFGAPKAALRVGDLKLVCWCYSVAGVANATTTGCVPDPQAPGAWPQLYNLTADPGETTDLAQARPNDVQRLEAALAAVASASVEPMQWTAPYQGPGYACAACPRHPPCNGDPEEPWTAWLQ